MHVMFEVYLAPDPDLTCTCSLSTFWKYRPRTEVRISESFWLGEYITGVAPLNKRKLGALTSLYDDLTQQ